MRDLPHNTNLSFEALIPTTSNADPLPQREKQAWFNNHGFAYVQLVPGADSKAVAAKLKPIIDRSVDPKVLGNLNMPASAVLQINLTPFQDLHLSTDRYGGMKAPGSWTTIYGFAAIGIPYPGCCLFQFHQLGDRSRHFARARGGAAQSNGGNTAPVDCAIHRRVNAYESVCVCSRTRPGRSVAAKLRRISDGANYLSLSYGLAGPVAGAIGVALASGLLERRLSRLCALELSPGSSPARQPNQPRSIGHTSYRAGRVAICRINRPRNRSVGDLRPNFLCAEYGPRV